MNDLLEAVTGLRLLHPWALLLLVAIPVALLLRRRRGEPWIRFAAGPFVHGDDVSGEGRGDGPLPASPRTRLVGAPRILQTLALLLVVVALARPVRREVLPLRTEGIDVLLCVDVSSSMAARDMDGRRTRLDVVRESALRFVAGRRDDRIGLVCFARYPDVRCPPTQDHEALAALLAGVTLVENNGPEDATGIGTAVARAAQALRTSASPSRVVILLTDGDENVARPETPAEIAPLHAAQLCADLGVRVYGIRAGGSAAGAAPGGGAVREIAERTGGRAWEARDAASLASVVAAIDALERAALDRRSWTVSERFAPFLAAGLLLALLARFLDATWLDVGP